MPTGTTATGITVAKTAGYVGSIWIFEYLDIPQTQVAILGILMVLDFVSGIGKQYVIDPRGITSDRAWLGAIKKVGTFVALFTVALVMKAMEMEADGYVKGLLAVFIAADGYSIIQNVYAIRTGQVLPEFDAISIVLKTVSEKIKDFIERGVSKQETADAGERRKSKRK